MKGRYIKALDVSPSPLGFGVMRLPMNPGGTFPESVHALLAEAYARGVNYFDTAYPYLGGHSEELIRDALVAKYPRETFYIADKLPVWDCRSLEDMDRIFEIQLKRLGTDYIDFYLLHGLHKSRWQAIHSKGALGFLTRKRGECHIRRIGFSFHDTADALPPILDAHDWDFVQLQLNYYDWSFQRAKECYEVVTQRGIPCLVMEPVGGGRLACLPKEANALLEAERPGASPASWALRFAAALPNVAVTLSGMSDAAQLADNLSVFDGGIPALSEAERAALERVAAILRAQNAIPCTACAYCVDVCPKNVDIPQIFKRYNDSRQFQNMAAFHIDYNAFVPPQRNAANCIVCGKCVELCPQKIDIPKELGEIRQFLNKGETKCNSKR